MLLKFHYSDGETVEHEVDGASSITVDGPARNADGAIINGRLPATYPIREMRGPGGDVPHSLGPIRSLVDVTVVADA
jgi:hypothetical protein